MSVTFEPVGGWFVVAVMALAVTALTLWAYLPRLRTTTGAWRWFALGLRLAAVLLCLLAALRPSLIIQEKKKVPAVVMFLVDDSKSMQIRDEAGDKSRWELARERGEEGVAAAKKLGEDLSVRSLRFDVTLREDPVDKSKKDEPEGQGTSIGPSLIEAPKRESGVKVAAIFLLSDGANNLGMSPLLAARELRAQAIPVYTVGFGDPTAGSKSKDIAIRDIVAGPTVYVKNVLDVKGTLVAHGFAGQRLELEMYVEDQPLPVAVRRITVPEGTDIIPFSGLKYVPQTPGEKKITIKVKPKEGELVRSNNEIGTFVSVLQGGLNVLFIQGPHSAWEQKFWLRSVAESPDIQGELRIIRRPATDAGGDLSDEDFAPGRYNVYVLSDLPANFLTPTQQALLARNVEKSGAGLIMLGGRSSFGPGGWGSSPLANVLPMFMTPRDGQVEPKEGVRFTPNPRGLEKFLLQIGPTRQESARIWSELPPLSGINHLGRLKDNALVFGVGGDQQEPVMVGADVGTGRVLAFGGETWPWRRSFHADGRLAHKKFWRQTIFWLAHKEDTGDNEVKITIDGPRRIATGQKLDFRVTARDAKGEPIPNVKYTTKVEQQGDSANPYVEKLDVFNSGADARQSFIADSAPPGDYTISVIGARDGKEVGHDSARFLIYQDDREMENPAADHALLRQVAEATGGEALKPEELRKKVESLKGSILTESYNPTEWLLWDNWPFLLLFATLLTLEWFLRKRHGWV